MNNEYWCDELLFKRSITLMWRTCCPSRQADTCSLRLRLRLRSLHSLCRRWTGRRRCGAPAQGRREACGRPRHQLTLSLTASALINKANTKIRRQKQEGHIGGLIIAHSLLPDACTLLRLLLLVRDSWLELSLNPLQLDWRIRAE